MGKQTKSRKSADHHIGKGKVTPVQIAFIVDRYLLDNNFTHSRSTFRHEASSLIAKSPVQEAPRSLLSLAAILNEYITLKEQKVWMDQERHLLEQEKLRVQNFLSGMQEVMNAYNAGGNNGLNPHKKVPVAPSGNLLLQNDLSVKTPAGYCPTYNSPAMISTSELSTIRTEATDFSTPVPCNVATCKRKLSNNVSDGKVAPKKFRTPSLPKDVNSVTQSNNVGNNRVKTNMESAAHTLARVNVMNTSPVQGSNVVKCLFNQKPPSPPSSSSVPKTPQQASPPQTENSVSPLENCSTAATSKHATPQKIISANCTIISSETIRVSPNKQIAYYSIEKNQISACSPLKTRLTRPNTKDHVKGRLDFGASETPVAKENTSPESNHTSESEQGGDFLDLDLEALGLDFNLSEFFADFDMQNEELGSSSQQVLGSSPESFSGSPDGNTVMGGGQVISQNSSAVAGFLGENDMDFMGSESVAAVRSVTKCITILSPVKNQKS